MHSILSLSRGSASLNSSGDLMISGKCRKAQEDGKTTALPGFIAHRKAVTPNSMTEIIG